jgi:ankyrin repeat protein
MSMHELVAQDDIRAMQTTVEQNPQSVNELNESGLPPLYTAARHRNRAAVEFLLNQGATLDIFACGYLGKANEAELLLARSPEQAQAATASGMTPLHFAARAGYYDVANVLLRCGADVNARDRQGNTALIEACHGGPWKPQADDQIVQLLLDNNAHVDLFKAAAIGRADLIEAILDDTANVIDDLNMEEETALHVAAQNNQFAAVKLLVERGANINRSDAVGIAALHRTSGQCSDELIQYLIDHGANAHLCCYVACGDERGTLQALARNPDTVEEFLYEYNAVGYAIHCWQLGTLRVLLRHGANLSKEDQGHILRISGNDQELLGELISINEDGD